MVEQRASIDRQSVKRTGAGSTKRCCCSDTPGQIITVSVLTAETSSPKSSSVGSAPNQRFAAALRISCNGGNHEFGAERYDTSGTGLHAIVAHRDLAIRGSSR